MTDMSTVDDRLGWFIEKMRSKLAVSKNLAKGDWRDASENYLVKRIDEEIVELKIELFDAARPDPEKIIKECSDVANFAFMLADWVKAHPEEFAG
jgi:hypothetical protein